VRIGSTDDELLQNHLSESCVVDDDEPSEAQHGDFPHHMNDEERWWYENYDHHLHEHHEQAQRARRRPNTDMCEGTP